MLLLETSKSHSESTREVLLNSILNQHMMDTCTYGDKILVHIALVTLLNI